MGSGLQKDSQAVFESNTKMQLSTENLKRIRSRKDFCLGVFTEYEYLPTGQSLGMKQLVVDNERLLSQKNLERLLRRTRIVHQNLLSIYGFSYTKNEKFILSFYFESFAAEAGLEFAMRMESKTYFQEPELLASLEACVSVLNHLQNHDIFHGNLVPQAIYMTKDGELKLADASLLDQELTMYRACVSKQKICYLSPEMLDMAGKKVPTSSIPQKNLHKADVFSIGMVFLYAALLEEPDDCYNWRIFSFNRESLEYRLELLFDRYPGKFANLMSHLLQINVEERPDFIGIVNNLAQYENQGLICPKPKASLSKNLLSNFNSPTFGGSTTNRFGSVKQDGLTKEPLQLAISNHSPQEPIMTMSSAEIDRRIRILQEPFKKQLYPEYEHDRLSPVEKMTTSHLIQVEPLKDFSGPQQALRDELHQRTYEDDERFSSKSPVRSPFNPRVLEIIKETKEKYSHRPARNVPRIESELKRERITHNTERYEPNHVTRSPYDDKRYTSRISETSERYPQERRHLHNNNEGGLKDTKDVAVRDSTPYKLRNTTESAERQRGRNFETQESSSRPRRKPDSIERADALIKKIRERNEVGSGAQRVSTRESYIEDRNNYDRKSPLREYLPNRGDVKMAVQTPKYNREERSHPTAPIYTEHALKSYQKISGRAETYLNQDKPSTAQFDSVNSQNEREKSLARESQTIQREKREKLSRASQEASKSILQNQSPIIYRIPPAYPHNTPLKEQHVNLSHEKINTDRPRSPFRKEDPEIHSESHTTNYSRGQYDRSPNIRREDNRQISPRKTPYRSALHEKENQFVEAKDYQRVDIKQIEIRHPLETQRVSARPENTADLASSYSLSTNQKPAPKSNTIQKNESWSFHVDSRGYGLSDDEIKNAKIVQDLNRREDRNTLARERKLKELRSKYSSFV